MSNIENMEVKKEVRKKLKFVGVRIEEEDYERLLHLGDGNFSVGLRSLLSSSRKDVDRSINKRKHNGRKRKPLSTKR